MPAKNQIIRFQSAEDYVIFNPTHKIPAEIAAQSLARKVCFSLNRHSEPDLFLPNVPPENSLAAITAASVFAVPSSAVRQAVINFKPLPHRLEKIGEYRGITFYDDSIATIPRATIHALNALGEKVETLIAGGFDRGLDYTDLGVFLANRKGLKNIILFPDTGKKIWQAILSVGENQPLHRLAGIWLPSS